MRLDVGEARAFGDWVFRRHCVDDGAAAGGRVKRGGVGGTRVNNAHAKYSFIYIISPLMKRLTSSYEVSDKYQIREIFLSIIPTRHNSGGGNRRFYVNVERSSRTDYLQAGIFMIFHDLSHSFLAMDP